MSALALALIAAFELFGVSQDEAATPGSAAETIPQPNDQISDANPAGAAMDAKIRQ